MAIMTALAAIVVLIAGVIAAAIGMVSVAIHREEKNLTLTREAPDQLTSAVRWLNGVYAHVPRPTVANREKAPVK